MNSFIPQRLSAFRVSSLRLCGVRCANRYTEKMRKLVDVSERGEGRTEDAMAAVRTRKSEKIAGPQDRDNQKLHVSD